MTTIRPSARHALGAVDLHLFNEGNHRSLGTKMGAHPLADGGASFSVWAPNATRVGVIGDFNGWDRGAHELAPRGASGVWEGAIDAASPGDVYKFAITTRTGVVLEKADPFARCTEVPPRTGSVLWDLSYEWGDADWMAARPGRPWYERPISIYEVHLGSWRRPADEPGQLPRYEDVAEPLIEHVLRCGFTHVEFLPLTEHPFYGSWGYQTTGYFAPTRRYGDPQDLMGLIDRLHRAGIGVVLDWVPSHFPEDAFALANFDGTHLFEHADPRLGFHPDWKSLIFNYGRHEVRSFLASSAEHWLSTYHADGLRVDAVASMLYRDYSRAAGEWLPNEHGGRENLEAIEFIRRMNTTAYRDFPGIVTVAEESTAWPGVSRPVDGGGLGFGYKWNMGWMHDTLKYIQEDPVHRKHHHDKLTFGLLYAWDENFILPISHDEVVHGKGSLIGKMPGDTWQKFANLRAYLAFMWTHPGKKLLFMGCEFGQHREWSHDHSLDWHLLDDPAHKGVQALVRDLNALYRGIRSLHELDCESSGFAWIDGGNANDSVLAYLRKGTGDANPALVVCNFTPVVRSDYRIGVPSLGRWAPLLNTDRQQYGGSGVEPGSNIEAEPKPWHGQPNSISITLPPLAVLVLVEGEGG